MKLLLSNLKIPVEQDGAEEPAKAAAHQLQVGVDRVNILKILSKSIDLLDQEQFYYKWSIVVQVSGGYDNPQQLPLYQEPVEARRREATLKERRADFDTCRRRYRQLRVRVVDGRAELAEIDAMPYSGVGDDVCLRDGLSRIPFPRVTKPADFVVPLDLRRKEDKAR